jgi:uncharacterized protein CbrC (UPF0167 family)
MSLGAEMHWFDRPDWHDTARTLLESGYRVRPDSGLHTLASDARRFRSLTGRQISYCVPMSPVDGTPTPFPLYAAPLVDAAEYRRSGQCSLCGQASADRFALGVGAYVVHDCTTCRRPFAVRADGHGTAPQACSHCLTSANLTPLPVDPAVCVACLRGGRAALTKDTEYGMVRWDDAILGRTHGVPGLRRVGPGFAMLEPGEDGWTKVAVDTAVLLELVRTPSYSTWQGAEWRFCCANAMRYVGEWTQQDVSQHAPADPAAAFTQIFEGLEPSMWQFMARDRHDDAGIDFHVFQCQRCGAFRGHCDMS